MAASSLPVIPGPPARALFPPWGSAELRHRLSPSSSAWRDTGGSLETSPSPGACEPAASQPHGQPGWEIHVGTAGNGAGGSLPAQSRSLPRPSPPQQPQKLLLGQPMAPHSQNSLLIPLRGLSSFPQPPAATHPGSPPLSLLALMRCQAKRRSGIAPLGSAVDFWAAPGNPPSAPKPSPCWEAARCWHGAPGAGDAPCKARGDTEWLHLSAGIRYIARGITGAGELHPK